MAFLPVSLADSQIEYELSLEAKLKGAIRCHQVIRIVFRGEFGVGSLGNSNANFMAGVIRFAVTAWDCRGAIIDLREIEYEWGDGMQDVIDAGCATNTITAFMVGPKCEKAIQSLLVSSLPGVPPSLTELEQFFHSEQEALAYLRTYKG